MSAIFVSSLGMTVKGTAFLARAALMIERVGQSAWDKFIETAAADVAFLGSITLPARKIPMAEFLQLSDKIVEHFFDGDKRTHWMFGEKSADWAFSKGPYKAFFDERDVRTFVSTAPALWAAYYDEGAFVGDVDEGVVDIKLTGVPIKHVHFEFTVMGYVKRGLELIGTTVERVQAVTGFSTGEDDVHYRFTVK